MAKDMAAFANALGGSIIVGTTRDHEPLDYPGLKRDFAEKLSHEFDLAHRDALSPKPVVERHIFETPSRSGAVVLAVNVHPYPDQFVAAKISNEQGALIQHAWRFPVRTGAQTTEVDPAMLHLFSPQVRRAAILLERIPDGAIVELILVNTLGALVSAGDRAYRGVDYDTNVLKLEDMSGRFASQLDWHPLDQVFTVYFGSDKKWRVKIRC